MDYKNKIIIDPNNLENEWMEQPANYLDAWELYSEAVEDRDKKKARLDIIYAELDSKIRTSYKKLGFDSKPTEPQIKEWIKLQKKHKKAELSLIRANKQVNLTNGIKQAFSHRKDALGNIVSMKLSGYYSEPTTTQKKNLREKEKLDGLKVRKMHEKMMNDPKRKNKKRRKEDGKKLS